MNLPAIRAIYKFEMSRTRRTVQSIVSPVLSTSLYFVVFGAAIGSRIQQVEGIPHGAFIVPGLIMLSLLTRNISNASFGIYFQVYGRSTSTCRRRFPFRDRLELRRRRGTEVDPSGSSSWRPRASSCRSRCCPHG
jgi:hypothetical protein